MTQRILIIGAGFAGMWSALGAARLIDQAGTSAPPVEVALIAPEPKLHIRPRFYENDLSTMAPPIDALLDVVGVRYIQGTVDRIHAADNTVEFTRADGRQSTIGFDRLVLASGSKLFRPNIPGIQNAFSVDQLDEVIELDAHLRTLAAHPDTPARNTVVVAGGGFTGIETAAEMPARLRAILGDAADVNVIVVEQAEAIGPDLGPGPRPVIEQALHALGVTQRLGTAITAVDADGVTTSHGDRILASTVIWTAGLRASALTEQIPGERDPAGRLHVSPELRVIGANNVFATGDVAFAATDDQGNHAKMSCQHALRLGRSAGHNVAADLLGLPLLPYSQTRYVTCLDLGPWGAVYTEGWAREVKLAGAEAKALKHRINTEWIYPPRADRAEAFAAADPTLAVVA